MLWTNTVITYFVLTLYKSCISGVSRIKSVLFLVQPFHTFVLSNIISLFQVMSRKVQRYV